MAFDLKNIIQYTGKTMFLIFLSKDNWFIINLDP